jgi:hypothetical protein
VARAASERDARGWMNDNQRGGRGSGGAYAAISRFLAPCEPICLPHSCKRNVWPNQSAASLCMSPSISMLSPVGTTCGEASGGRVRGFRRGPTSQLAAPRRWFKRGSTLSKTMRTIGGGADPGSARATPGGGAFGSSMVAAPATRPRLPAGSPLSLAKYAPLLDGRL